MKGHLVSFRQNQSGKGSWYCCEDTAVTLFMLGFCRNFRKNILGSVPYKIKQNLLNVFYCF